MDTTLYKNKILQTLDPEIIARLQLRPVKLESGREIEVPGAPIDPTLLY